MYRMHVMKNTIGNKIRLITAIIFAAVITFTTGCQKQNNESLASNTGCITRLMPDVADYNVSGAQLDSIYAIFSANNLSVTNLQFKYWTTGTTINPSGYSGYQEQVTAVQFLNGLPVFADDKFFDFNAGVYQPAGVYDGYTGPAPGANISSRQTLSNLHDAFFAHLSESYRTGGILNSKPFIPSGSTYTNACLTATLGYLDQGLIKGNAYILNKSLIKVWVVTPAESTAITYYPIVYVEDDNGFAWGQPFLDP
jgi:hypothetical protein